MNRRQLKALLCGLVIIAMSGASIAWAQSFTGTNGDDHIVGTPQADYINAGGGSDHVEGLGGDDTILGYGGADRIEAGAGNDTVDGATENDEIDGQDGDDTLVGWTGADTISGGAGDDSIDGGPGNDTLAGGDGNDTAVGDAGDDTFDGGAGHDSYSTNWGSDTANGGAGLDWLRADSGAQTLRGGDDNDVIYSLEWNSDHRFYGDDGNDIISGWAPVLEGGDGNDVLTQMSYQPVDGGPGNDICRKYATVTATNCEAVVTISPSNYNVPTLSVTSAPAENSTLASSTFTATFTTTKAAAVYCMLDSGAITDCTSGTYVPVQLTVGRHALAIVALPGGQKPPAVAVRHFTVVDTTPPVITVPVPGPVEATQSSGATAAYAVTATDNLDGVIAPACVPASGFTFPIGTTTVSCTATDAAGNTATASFTIVVQDTTPPVLDLPGGRTAEATSAAGAVVTFDVAANDVVDGPSDVTCSPASGSTFALGLTAVQCSTVDSRGNAASGDFDVTVEDTTPPSAPAAIGDGVSIHGAGDVDWNTSGTEVTASWSLSSDTASGFLRFDYCITTEPSATECDPIPGGSGSTIYPGVNKSFPAPLSDDGTTYFSCVRAVDVAGNASGYVCSDGFRVDVTPPTQPVIIQPALAATIAPTSAYQFRWAASLDMQSGLTNYIYRFGRTGVASVQYSSIDPEAVVNLSQSGDYEWSVWARDYAGNESVAAEGTFTVAVADTLPPVIMVPSLDPVEATQSGGAVVGYAVTATDNVDGLTAPVCVPTSGFVFPIESTTVSCTATDVAGNVASASFVVVVQDTTPPVLDLPSGRTVEATSAAGAVVVFDATANDLVDGLSSVTCLPESGSTFALGLTAVQCSTVDSRGNFASGTFNVNVQDTTLPPAPTLVNDGLESPEVDWIDPTQGSTSIAANWAPARPAGELQWCATVTETCEKDPISPWVDAAEQQSTVDLGPAGLLAPPGAVFRFCVRTQSSSGTHGRPVCTDGQTVADVAPRMGTVIDGAGPDDARFTVTGTAIEASWAPASYELVPVAGYAWRVCDAAADCSTSLASGTTTATAIHVASAVAVGRVVKTCVVVTDVAGRASMESCSNGTTIVAQVPAPTVTTTFVGYESRARSTRVPFVINGTPTTIAWPDASGFGTPGAVDWTICKGNPCGATPPFGQLVHSGSTTESSISMDLSYPDPTGTSGDTYWMCSNHALTPTPCSAFTVVRSAANVPATSPYIYDNVGGVRRSAYRDDDTVPVGRGVSVRWGAPNAGVALWELCLDLACNTSLDRGLTSAGNVHLRSQDVNGGLVPGTTYFVCVTQWSAGGSMYSPGRACDDGFTVDAPVGTTIGNPQESESNVVLEADEHWTVEDSPYIVYGPINVGDAAEGTTLTIDPGVQVYFTPNAQLLFARGSRLLVNGTSSAPVRFDVLGETEVGARRVNIAGPRTRLRHLHVNADGASERQIAVTTFATATDLIIEDSIFDSGAQARDGGSTGSAVSIQGIRTKVRRSEFAGGGLSIVSSTGVSVTDSRFERNSVGIGIYVPNPSIGRAVVTRNWFDGNGADTSLRAGDIFMHVERAGRNGVALPDVYGNRFSQSWGAPNLEVSGDISGIVAAGGLRWLDNDWRLITRQWCMRYPLTPPYTPEIFRTGWPQLSVSELAPGEVTSGSRSMSNHVREEFVSPKPCPGPRAGYGSWFYSGKDEFPVVPSGHSTGMLAPGLNSADPTGQQSDPVNSQSGAFTHERDDLPLDGLDAAFDMTRTYNSFSATTNPNSVLGAGWNTILDTHLEISGDEASLVDRIGGAATYFRDGDSDSWAPSAGTWGSMTSRSTDGEIQSFEVVTRAGETWTFNLGGRLTDYADRHGNGFSIFDAAVVTDSARYADTSVVLLTTGTRVVLTFDPATRRLTQMRVSDGRIVRYVYDAGAHDRLVRVEGLAGRLWRYGYDERGRLACEHNANDHLVFENQYDDAGRVELQWDGARKECRYLVVNGVEYETPWTRWTYYANVDGTSTTVATDPAGAEWADVYDADGRMIARIDPTDRCTTFGYDENNNRTLQVRADGRVIRSAFDGQGRITERRTELLDASTPWRCPAAGAVPTQAWECPCPRPVPTATTLDEPVTERFTYDDEGLLTEASRWFDGKAKATARTVNEWVDGHLRERSIYPDQNEPDPADPLVTKFTHDARGLTTSETDPRNKTWRRTWNARGLMESETPPGRGTTEYEYDARGFVSEQIEPLRNGHKRRSVTRYTHDDAGHVTSTTDAYGESSSTTYFDTGSIDTLTNALGEETKFTYNDFEEPVRIERPAETTTLAYDVRGLLTRTSSDIGQPTPEITEYEYDAAGRPWKVLDPSGHATNSGAPIPGRERVMTYDEAGRAARVDMPGGRRTATAYDALDRVVATTTSHVAGAVVTPLKRSEIDYDDRNGKTAFSEVSVVDGSKITQWSITDGFGRVVKSVDARGKAWNYQLDRVGNVTRITSPEGRITTRAYTDDGLVDATVASGAYADPANPGESLEDPDDASLSVVDNYRTSFEYDAAGELTAQSQQGRVLRFERDRLGRAWRTIDPVGDITDLTYDELGRVVAVTGPDGATLHRDFQEHGRKVVETDPRGHTWTKTYDARGRMLTSREPDAKLWSQTFDAGGRLTQSTDPANRTVTATYDALGRTSSIAYSATPTENVSWTYDDADRTTRQTDAHGVETRVRDGFGRLVHDIRPGHHDIAYTWDDVGNRLAMTVAGSSPSAWTYDDDGLQSSVTSNDLTTAFDYGAAGTLDRIEHAAPVAGDPLVETRRYDAFGDLSGLDRRAGTTVSEDLGVIRDASGRITRVDRIDGSADRFSYADGRLAGECHGATCADGGAGWTTYSYDANGNRTRMSKSGETTEFQYDPSDRLTTKEQSGESPITYEYDTNGNLENDGVHRFWRGQSGRLIGSAAAGSSAPTTTYAYSGTGQRLATTSPAGSVSTVWDTAAANGVPQVVAEFDADEQLLRSYAYGPAGLDRVATPSGTHYAGVSPVVGSIEQMIDTEGSVEAQQRFDAWGAKIAATSTFPTTLGFAGESLDAAGMYNLRARNYSPATGTFDGVDPVQRGDTQRWNGTYGYAENVPTLYTDPMGTCAGFGGYCIGFNPQAGLDAIVNIGRGATGGATDDIANAISPGASSTVEQNTGQQVIGAIGGIAAGGLSRVGAGIALGSGIETTGQSAWGCFGGKKPRNDAIRVNRETECLHAGIGAGLLAAPWLGRVARGGATGVDDGVSIGRPNAGTGGADGAAAGANPFKYGTTPGGIPFTTHYATETGPVRNIPGSLIDHVVNSVPGVPGRNLTTVYYDPANDVTVVLGQGGVVSARRGRSG